MHSYNGTAQMRDSAIARMISIIRRIRLKPFQWHETVKVTLADKALPKKGDLYIRTAYRNDPDFTVTGITRAESPSEQSRFARVIENDQTVSDNYSRLVYETMASVYDQTNDSKTVSALREELIGAVQASMKAVFDGLVLNSISDPLWDGYILLQQRYVLILPL
jgi:hypothetical protein